MPGEKNSRAAESGEVSQDSECMRKPIPRHPGEWGWSDVEAIERRNMSPTYYHALNTPLKRRKPVLKVVQTVPLETGVTYRRFR